MHLTQHKSEQDRTQVQQSQTSLYLEMTQVHQSLAAITSLLQHLREMRSLKITGGNTQNNTAGGSDADVARAAADFFCTSKASTIVPVTQVTAAAGGSEACKALSHDQLGTSLQVRKEMAVKRADTALTVNGGTPPPRAHLALTV